MILCCYIKFLLVSYGEPNSNISIRYFIPHRYIAIGINFLLLGLIYWIILYRGNGDKQFLCTEHQNIYSYADTKKITNCEKTNKNDNVQILKKSYFIGRNS